MLPKNHQVQKCILHFLYQLYNLQSEFKCKQFVETLHVNFWFAVSYILWDHSYITFENWTLQEFSHNLILFYGTYCVFLELKPLISDSWFLISISFTGKNEKIKMISPEQGLEPWTFRLKAWRSTNWATRAS